MFAFINSNTLMYVQGQIDDQLSNEIFKRMILIVNENVTENAK